MNDENSSTFTVIDHCMFWGLLVISGAIGLYTSYIGNRSPEEFLMGNRSFKPFPVALSLLTSYISSLSLLGYSGEAYANGIQMSVFIIGNCLAIVSTSYLVLPILFPLKLTSITEYIELRFKSKHLRMIVLLVKIIGIFILSGVFLYAPTMALVAFTNISTLNYILLLGMICTLYSTFGGIRAVIWTDVFQVTVMLVGLIIVVTVGSFQNGGIIKTLHISSEGGRLSIFDMSLSPFVRNTFFNTFGFGLFYYGFTYSCFQISTQRACSVKSIEDGQSVRKYNVYGMTVINVLIFLGGLVAYAAYYGCDPMAQGIIKKKEQIMIYFISDKLNFVPGLSGLFTATLIAGSLSSISSNINSIVAMMWKDVCLKFSFFQNASSKSATITNKILSFAVGSIIIGLGIASSENKSLIDFSYTIGGPFLGSIFGIFIIGYFLPICNMKGVWIGWITSITVTLWLAIGGLYYKMPPTPLPFSIDDCQHLNLTPVEASQFQNFLHEVNNVTEEPDTNGFSITDLYQISFTLYAIICPLLCALLAIIVSLVTGFQRLDEISPKLISPSVRRFYWTKEELRFLHENEIRVCNCDTNVDVDENGEERREMPNSYNHSTITCIDSNISQDFDSKIPKTY